MKVLGIISEYNPFHLGHKYHIETSKAQTGTDYVVAVMSGSVVQRGEFAIMEPHRRASIALTNGVDLVLELPLCYSSQSAEIFSKGSIHILSNLGIINEICCGSEAIDSESLDKVVPLLANESAEYKEKLEYHLTTGNSFPKARALALKDLTGVDIVSNPNDTLAIEYKKALTKCNSDISFSTIKRMGQDYNSSNLNEGFASATGIREAFRHEKFDQLKTTLPDNSLVALLTYGHIINVFDHLQFLIQRDKHKLKDIFDVEEGIDNKIIKELKNASSKEELITNIKSKRYTYTRLSRILNNILLNINKDDIKYVINSNEKPYAKILGFNSKGQELIKKIDQSKITLINKPSTFEPENKLQEILWRYDNMAADVYLSLSKEEFYSQKQISPVVIKP